MGMIGDCRLCGQNKELKESHIISKFAYKDIKKYDKKIINLNQFCKKVCPDTQDGPKEYLFCDDCEQKRSKTETYFSNLINRNVLYKPPQKYIVDNIDYAKFKLFVMWSIYAFYVSSQKGNVEKLFDPYLPDVEDLLIRNDPGDVDEFGFTIWFLSDIDTDSKTLVIPPSTKKVDNNLIVDLILKGLFFRVMIKGKADSKLIQHFLQKKGSIWIRKIKLRLALRKIGLPV